MPTGPFGWIAILRKISDEDMKMLTGTDSALYIIFLRYSWRLFLTIFVINLFVVVPIYSSGKPLPSDDAGINEHFSSLQLVTILNITASPVKVVSTYAIMLVIYSGLAFTMAYFYWRKSMEWRYRMHSH